MLDWVMNQIMKNKIMEILRGLMACGGVTNTEKEIITENWLLDFFRQLPYFQKYPEQYCLGSGKTLRQRRENRRK